MEKTSKFYKNDRLEMLVTNEGGKLVYMDVEVLDVLKEFGKFRYLITPLAGSGEMKVEASVLRSKE